MTREEKVAQVLAAMTKQVEKMVERGASIEQITHYQTSVLNSLSNIR